MPNLAETFINYWFKHTGKLALLAAAWFVYSLGVTYSFANVMEHTLTASEDAAFLEAGVLALLIGNDIITFCLLYQFTALRFYHTQVSWVVWHPPVVDTATVGERATDPGPHAAAARDGQHRKHE